MAYVGMVYFRLVESQELIENINKFYAVSGFKNH